MHPALPDEPPHIDVGEFEQGTPVSRWALARYLVGRAVADSVSRSLLIVAVVILGCAALAQWVLHSTVLAVLLVLVALGWLALRAVLRAVLKRVIAADQVGPLDARLRSLVSDTRADVLRELRRVGLPGRTWTLPLVAFRLLGRRRQATLQRLREFNLERAVPRGRLDELHLLLRSVDWRGRGPG